MSFITTVHVLEQDWEQLLIWFWGERGHKKVGFSQKLVFQNGRVLQQWLGYHIVMDGQTDRQADLRHYDIDFNHVYGSYAWMGQWPVLM